MPGHPGAPAMMVCLPWSTARLSVTSSLPSSPLLSAQPCSFSEPFIRPQQRRRGLEARPESTSRSRDSSGSWTQVWTRGPTPVEAYCIAIHIIVLGVPRAGTLRSYFRTVSSNGSATQLCSFLG